MYSKLEQRWVRILQAKYLDSGEKERILTVRDPPRGSALWNFLVSCRSLITNHISWHIGDGRKVNFWQDSWDGHPSLESQAFQQIVLKTCQVWGSKVCDFLSNDTPLLGQRRSWKGHRDLNLGEEEERYLSKILGNREVLFSKEEDEIIWCGSKSKCYLVKVGITLLERDAKMKEWESKICWNNVCLPKAGAFAWLAGNKRILSGDRLKKMGFASPFHYVLCEKADEDVDHLLLNCDFAQKAWLFGLQRLN
ncbi:uncharacterized protein LOC131070874 [Cryptomeria japonica]|uniref:uncharacterized protein LOC131070874 n=1 Tax=Cryptomeria japonica TaxID=3369 RepID=UPI0027D9E082|nr:uncharacterized protein LOC131070874 [Cryptomeria japonica]